MTDERVNADFSQPVLLDTDAQPWIASPQPGVERRLLDRIGGEVARATSLVRYAPGRSFPAHTHALGEEFLVLDGVFSDEHGDYPAGTYVRNPPGSSHAPRTGPGCTIFVKLRQMQTDEAERVVRGTAAAAFAAAGAGLERLALFEDARETVAVERLAAGAAVPPAPERQTEILVLSGGLRRGESVLGPRNWLRLPPGAANGLSSPGGCVYWVKRSRPFDPT